MKKNIKEIIQKQLNLLKSKYDRAKDLYETMQFQLKSLRPYDILFDITTTGILKSQTIKKLNFKIKQAENNIKKLDIEINEINKDIKGSR